MLACTNNTLRQGLVKGQSAQHPKTQSAPQGMAVALRLPLLARPKRFPHCAISLWPTHRRAHLAKTLPVSNLWIAQPQVTSAAMPPAQRPQSSPVSIPTTSSRASIHLSMAMVRTEALARRTGTPGWPPEMAMYTTHTATLESCNPSLGVRHPTNCSRVPSKGVGSILLRCSSRTAMVVGLTESVKTVSHDRYGASVAADILKALLVHLATTWADQASDHRRACRACNIGQGKDSGLLDRSFSNTTFFRCWQSLQMGIRSAVSHSL